ncbi:MAG: hypothetical protein C0467_08090 [Planctomycetaceae bacterium]|nr:hypothetical protein [Planctomycetaceae bacterium]
MSQSWYTDSGGWLEGPMSSRELRDRASSGKLRPTDKVSPDGQKWAPASKIKGLTFSDTVDQPGVTIAAVVTPPKVGSSSTQTPKGNSSDVAAETTETKADQIPGYEIAGVLGKGACGVVFRARQVKLDRVVALKMVLTDRRPTPAALARFDKEAVSLAKLRHPNIVGVYDCGHHNGQAFFAMELLEGEDLGNRIDTSGPLDEFTAWHIARQTAAALAHAADLGVYHRDIKPANLFLTPPPTGYPLPSGVPLVKVTDFGLALTRQTGDESTDQRLTAAGVVLGTPAYMPPEQFAGSDIDHRADIYALGATIFHILSGDSPFNGASIWEVMIKKSEPTPRLGGRISEESADLVETMMAQKPADRVATYRELLDRIDSLPFMQGTVASSTTVRALSHSKSSGVGLPPRSEEEDEDDSDSPSGEWRKPAPRSKAKLYAFAALGGLALAGSVALGVKVLGGKQDSGKQDSVAKPDAPKSVTFDTGEREELFNHESLFGWSAKNWAIGRDEEKTSVMVGKGLLSRTFKAPKNYRVVLGLDLHEATSIDIAVAIAEGPPETAKRWSIRIDREKGAVLGVRDGENGLFQPLGPAIPLPTKQQIDDGEKGRYSEVRYERAGGRIKAFFVGKPLGEIEEAGTSKLAEVRVVPEGGEVRIDTALVEELIEKP